MSETRFEGLPQMQNNSLINISQVYESLRYNDYSVENGLGEIVDNSVDDDIYNDLNMHKEEYNYQLIKSPGNIGVGNGGNLGEKYAKGDYLLFLNSDVIIVNDAVGILYGYIN